MRFVLDASITITWALPDEAHPAADRAFAAFESGSALAPSIWWYEVRNILVQCERRGRIEPADSALFFASLSSFPIRLAGEPEESLVMRLARKHRLTVYDAAYLALAIEEHLPLATLDRALAEAATTEGVELVS